ncbi:helix-turn-helix domain-containing protein [Psychroserpens burtonensis]|uniref:Helix-turn-helix domain-containing protein n=1 Tax=Psychroserpens burtonensis TaxID=49278 RepID=A0A5C7BAV9_9FLAO|nr:helix-turn-helix domain-containing protein [Psychroserpens burtonensis]TXE18073.1 helix-turn-helix domain-containing protein [Psychroserpens burtonensis]
MELYKDIKKPTKKEQIVAMASYNALAATLEGLHSENPEIEIEETSEKIKIPLKALKLLAQILKATSQGKPISVVPIATEMTTQAAAELLGCSRPHFVKLLEQGAIPFTKVGRHRRVKFEDVINYKKAMKLKQEQLLKDMMKSDEELGLYNT